MVHPKDLVKNATRVNNWFSILQNEIHSVEILYSGIFVEFYSLEHSLDYKLCLSYLFDDNGHFSGIDQIVIITMPMFDEPKELCRLRVLNDNDIVEAIKKYCPC